MRRLIMLLFCAVCTVSMTFAQDAKKNGMEAVPVDNGAGCPVPPAKKSEHTHAH